MRTDSRALHTAERLWAVVLGLATVVAYLPGASRSFDYDGSVTVALFIRAPLGASLRDQYVTNNHQYFSFLEQLWSRMVGSSSEATLRVLPICFAGAAVALVAAEGIRRFGWLPGTAAGVVLATHPMFLTLAREVRGYSLLVLCAVASTLIVVREKGEGRWERPAYVAAVGLGIGTHLFMLWVVAAHVVYLRTRRRADGEWAFRWVAAILLGAVPYILTLDLIVGQKRGGFFEAEFPLRVVGDLLGTEPLTATVLGCLCLTALWRWRRDRLVVRLAALAAGAVLVTWLAPNQPAPRFFVWAVPGVALAAAAAVRTRAVLALALVPAVAAAILSVRDGYTTDSLANRQVAMIVEAARDEGRRVCGLGGSTETLYVYLDRPIPGYFVAAPLRSCDVVVVVNQALEPELVRAVRPAFAFAREVPAHRTGLVLSKAPLPR